MLSTSTPHSALILPHLPGSLRLPCASSRAIFLFVCFCFAFCSTLKPVPRLPEDQVCRWCSPNTTLPADAGLLQQLLEYLGKGKSIVDVGLAQARHPLSTRSHYFEVEIVDPGEKCYIALGLARKVGMGSGVLCIWGCVVMEPIISREAQGHPGCGGRALS